MPEAASLNSFDFLVLGIIFFTSLVAFIRGLSGECASFLNWVGAGVIVIYFSEPLQAAILNHISSEIIASFIASIGLYVVSFIIINLLTTQLSFFLRGIIPFVIDKPLGLCLGMIKGLFIATVVYISIMLLYPRMTGNTEEPEFIADAQTKFLLVSSTSVINHLLPGKNLNENLDASTEREERNLEDILQQLKGDPAKIDGSKLMILENILKNNKSTKELLDEESEKGDEAQETLPEDPKEKEGYGTNQLNEFDRLLENLE